MVVQHNLTAMNANRMLGLTTSAQAKSTEKLSSGYKINRAADDAAGLSISEKMRKQIRGLTQASANAEDGISAVQTAEGALNEVQDMLQRMNELAVKAANGTNSEDDRAYIQDEIDQLVTEIDRVAETTKFNETYLLKGDSSVSKKASYSYKAYASSSAATVTGNDGTTGTLDKDGTGLELGVEFAATASGDAQNELAKAIKEQGITVSYESTWSIDEDNDGTVDKASTKYQVKLNGSAADNYSVIATAAGFEVQDTEGNLIATLTASGAAEASATTTATSETASLTAKSASAAEVSGEFASYYDKDGNKISANSLGDYFSLDDDDNAQVRLDAPKVYDALGNETELDENDVAGARDITGALKLSLHVGADATANNQISVNIDAMSAKSLGVNGLKVDGATDSNALDAIETISEALRKVSTQRSALGAVQNRLEHTINNLDNVVENTTAAESQIRDTDMATEMVKYSNNNILAQAGQSMLAQANQSNQGVLSLLG